MKLSTILLICFASFTWSHLTGLPQVWKWKANKVKSRFVKIILLLISGKPFNCELCLSFWFTLAYCYSCSVNYYLCIAYALCAGGLANLIFKLFNKL